MGCYIWYSSPINWAGMQRLRPHLAVPNVTVHPLTASVPVTVRVARLLTRPAGWVGSGQKICRKGQVGSGRVGSGPVRPEAKI